MCARLFVTPWTVALQAPLSMGFSRQEYWSGLPFPPSGDLPDSGIKPRSPLALHQKVNSSLLSYLGKLITDCFNSVSLPGHQTQESNRVNVISFNHTFPRVESVCG